MSTSPADWAKAREMALRNLAEITPEEDAAITAAAEADPDNPPWDEETLSRMRPADPELIRMARRARAAAAAQRGQETAPAETLRNVSSDDTLSGPEDTEPG